MSDFSGLSDYDRVRALGDSASDVCRKLIKAGEGGCLDILHQMGADGPDIYNVWLNLCEGDIPMMAGYIRGCGSGEYDWGDLVMVSQDDDPMACLVAEGAARKRLAALVAKRRSA
jgi:hypothetical protein